MNLRANICQIMVLGCAVFASVPDFSLVGFATQNGGTTGGKGGKTVMVSTLADLKKYAEDKTTPYIIQVSGTISNGTTGAKLQMGSNKTLVGIGSSAFLSGVGIEVGSVNNVVVQNLKISLVGTSNPSGVNGGDAMVINGTSKNVWVDHCEFFAEDPKVQTNLDKYDGLLDIRDQTAWITVSWCYFHDHHKTMLIGAGDADIYADRKVTVHHTWFNNIVKRTPMMRGGIGHFFNNYIYGTGTSDGNTEASFAVDGVCLRVEKSHYENVHFAIYSATDGTKGYAERIDNIASQSRAWPGACTANIPYTYTNVLTTTTSDVKALVKQYAGVGKITSSISDEPGRHGRPVEATTSKLAMARVDWIDLAGNLVKTERCLLDENEPRPVAPEWKTGALAARIVFSDGYQTVVNHFAATSADRLVGSRLPK